MIFYWYALSDASGDDRSSLSPGFFGKDDAHHLSITVVEMAHRLVGKKEVEGLCQGPHKSYSLLLAEGQLTSLDGDFVTDAQPLEP